MANKTELPSRKLRRVAFVDAMRHVDGTLNRIEIVERAETMGRSAGLYYLLTVTAFLTDEAEQEIRRELAERVNIE